MRRGFSRLLGFLAAQHSFSVGAQKRLPGFDLGAQHSFSVRMRTGAPVMCTPEHVVVYRPLIGRHSHNTGL